MHVEGWRAKVFPVRRSRPLFFVFVEGGVLRRSEIFVGFEAANKEKAAHETSPVARIIIAQQL